MRAMSADEAAISARGATAARPPARVHLALLLVQLLFAGFAVVGMVVLGSVPPLAVAAFRVLLATPLLFLLAFRSDRRMPAARDLPLLALLGLLGVCANQVLFIFGLQRTTATNASILMLSIPVFTVAISAAQARERPPGRMLLGVALAVGGALSLLHPARISLSPGAVAGNALILANCLSYALFLVLQRPLLRRLPWSTVIAWAFLLGGAVVLPVSWHDLVSVATIRPGPGVWLGIGYMAVLATFVGYALSTWAVHHSSPALVSAYTTFQPLFAAGLAFAFLDERLGWAELVGFVLIAGGLSLVSGARRDTIADEADAGAAAP
jgi:drug/metabolite transporter (DMT)-like permease